MLSNAGIYKVSFTVSSVEPSQVAIFVNDLPIPTAIYGSGAGTQLNAGQAILVLPVGAVMTLKSHTSASAVMHGVAHLDGTPGTAVSHGCVRLAARSIRWLAARIPPGARVTITA